ncbi:tRNA lysidine(34) synthetase TilS [Altererythrobacter aquiaggeris]|uniref:tRNA lysidine(34) synthetase TilS n=1 Tax=Aestuarierythrobacter aquiaggeris TaxID=1898396 RepID=UPI003017AC91
MIARFRSALERCWDGEGRIGLAVSGGPDSMAMLWLAHAYMPDRIEVATVDHGLRAEAAQEAAMVALYCKTIGIPHQTLAVKVAGGNLQKAARDVRYAALDGWMADRGLAVLATAHHADDQAETLLMRLNRGSGVAGLAGVREVGNVPESSRPLIRPLLGWRREELASVCNAAGICTTDDPSNRDGTFDRVKIRNALSGATWLDVEAIAASASHLADADHALDWAADIEWQDCIERGGETHIYRPTAPRAIRLRVLGRIFAEFGKTPRGASIARLMAALENGKGASLAGVVATSSRGLWNFRAESGRRSEDN